MSAIFSILSKHSEYFFGERSDKSGFFSQAQSFCEHTFLARMRRLKNGWPLSAPPRIYFYHPQLLKKKFGKRSDKSGSFFKAQSFCEHTFLARMWCLKNGWPLSAPPRAYFYHHQLLKKNLVKAGMEQLSPKKFEKFWWKLKECKPNPYPVGHFGPPFASFRVKSI